VDEFRLDANRVVGRLLMGSFPPAGPFVQRYANVLVLCAKELQPPPEAFRGIRVINAPLNDDGTPMTDREVRTAQRAARAVRTSLDAGLVCLVTCHMGLNRSGLVAALALMLPQAAGGPRWSHNDTPCCLTSDQATSLVRRARGPSALGNPFFERMLILTDGICGTRPNAFRMGAFLP